MGIGALRWESLISVRIFARLFILYQMTVQKGNMITFSECSFTTFYILLIPFLQFGVSVSRIAPREFGELIYERLFFFLIVIVTNFGTDSLFYHVVHLYRRFDGILHVFLSDVPVHV